MAVVVTRRWIKYPMDLIRARFHVGRNPYTPESPAFVDEAWIEYAYLMESGEASTWSMKALADRWGWKSKGRVGRLMTEVQDFFADHNGTQTERKRNDAERPRNETERERNAAERQAQQNHDVTIHDGTTTERDGTGAERGGTDTERLTRAHLNPRSEIRDAEIEQIQTKTEKEPPKAPLSGDVVGGQDAGQMSLPQPKAPRKRTPKEPAIFPLPVELPDAIRARDDAPMWALVFPMLTSPEREQVILAVETWDRYTNVFLSAKNASLADVKAMIKIRLDGIYSLADIDDGINGMFVMARRPKSDWIFASGAHLPRKLFSPGGKLEEARSTWEQVSGSRRSTRDDLGRMQHGHTDAELWGG